MAKQRHGKSVQSPLGFIAAEGRVGVDRLTCEGMVTPLGIGTATPCYGWRLAGTEKGLRQTAWRVLVASSAEELAADTGDFWDSEWVTSPAQFGVEHAGPRLPEKTSCWWKVMAKVAVAGDRNVMVCSAPASFETGIFTRDGWLGCWAFGGTKPIYLRREFSVPGANPIRRARAYIGATGGKANTYELRVNGRRVGEDVMCPGQTTARRARYRTYDVTSFLQAGANAVGILHTSATIFQLEIVYADGSRQALFLENGWRRFHGGAFVSLRPDGKGESYDARLEPVGWDRAGFDDRAWEEFRLFVAKDFGPRFTDAQQDRVLAFDTFAPRSLHRLDENTHVVDFGQNQHGIVSFRVSGEAGRKITLRFGERLHADGALDPRSVGAPEVDEYTLRGDGEESYQPRFATHGFRYVEVKGWPGDLRPESISAHTVHSDILAASAFSCSNERLNRLHSAAVWSFRSNLVSVPTDCPARERNGWTGDALCHSQADCLNFRMGSFYDKWLTDVADSQNADGSIPWIAPLTAAASSEYNGTVDVPWMAAVVMVPWDYFQATGDVAFLRRHYPTMHRWLDSLLPDRDANGLLQHDLVWGDWCSHAVGQEPEAGAFLATVFYYQCLTRLQEIAGLLGEAADAARFAQQAQASAAGLNRVFRRDHGGYDVGTQTANALALAAGFVPPARRAETVRGLVDNIERRGAMTCGCLGAMVILDALAENQRNDLAFQLVDSTHEGNWGHWLTHGSTTAVEGFYSFIINSQNHAFLAGGLDAWFYRHLAGIQITQPGYAGVRIRPWLCAPLQQVRAQIETVKGLLAVEWRREDGRVMLDVTLPANTEAEIHLPTIDPSAIRVNGSALAANRWLTLAGIQDGCTIVKAGSGEYSFEMSPAPPMLPVGTSSCRPRSSVQAPKPGRPGKPAGGAFALPNEWHVFGPIGRNEPLATNSLTEVPEILDLGGAKLTRQNVKAENGRLDLAPCIGGTAHNRCALVYVPFNLETDGLFYFAAGADYALEVYLDGERLYSTIETTEAVAPALVWEHTVCTTMATERTLTKGRHLLVVRSVSGTGGSALCMGACRRSAD